MKPHCVPPEVPTDGDNSWDTQIAPTYTIDEKPAFFVQPGMGLLGPRMEIDFQLNFAPTEVALHHRSLHMVLYNIPDTENTNERSDNAESRKFFGVLSTLRNTLSVKTVRACRSDLLFQCVLAHHRNAPYRIIRFPF